MPVWKGPLGANFYLLGFYYSVADSTTPFSAIREGDRKLIYTYEKERCELYDLAEDIGEKHDLAAEKPAITAQLCKDLHDVLKMMGAQTPVDRESGKALGLPEVK